MNDDTNPPKTKSVLREYVEAIIVALILALIIRTFVILPFTIPSGSMEPTLLIGDYLLVTRFSYGVQNPFTGKYIIERQGPQYGDIIVFKYPPDTSQNFVKRVVGLPGDVLEVRNKQLYRNGEPVSETYIRHIFPNRILPLDNMPPFTVPEDQYFGMGDNRDNSSDSRAWGTIPMENIYGKAWRLYWSWDSGEKDRRGEGLRFNRLLKKLE